MDKRFICNNADSLFDVKENCCGCGACQSICPLDAINMIVDEEGFLYPSIDMTKCVKCNLCRNVCPLK